MFIFLLQIREYVSGDPSQLYLFSIAAALVWTSWAVKVVLSRRYRPWVQPHDIGTTVLIPVVDEPLGLFRDVLDRICQQGPTETIVVINGARNQALEGVCAEFPGVRHVWTSVAGKRNAIRVGMDHATQPIIVLVDSDTLWTDYEDVTGRHRTLDELVKPFADPRVGGVTTRQRILEPERSWLTRWADWLENSRALYSMPAQSVLGQIGCLPGRTIAFRREVVERSMPAFMGERFLGVFLEVSDDRTLTNYALRQGYRTVYQSTSLVYTDAPLAVPKLYKQQLRWARGSQYNTLRMLPWMLAHTPLLAFFFLVDIALPFLIVGALGGWVYRAVTPGGTNFYDPLLTAYPGVSGFVVIGLLVLFSSWFSMLVRQSRHLAEVSGDIWRMPGYVLAATLFMMPVRLLGFVRMAHAASWGTRKGAHTGAEVTTGEPDAVDLRAATTTGWDDVSEWEELEAHGGHRSGSLTMVRERTQTTRRTVEAVATTPAPAPTRPQRYNVYAVVPYGIAAGIFALESLVYVLP